MAHRKTLNERQLDVLKWISDGCPDGPISGISARISAGALRNRGLVTVSGGGPTWTAVSSRWPLTRVLRVLQGLVNESERRGYRVAVVPDSADLRY